MVQKFPQNRPPVCALTLANISGEKELNCVLICIIVHINEVSAYEYAFLFCCLIKKREGGAIMTEPAMERNRSTADEWITTLEPLPWQPRSGVGGSQACVSKFNKTTRDNTTAHTVEYTHHWRSRTSKTGKNYSSTTVALLQTSCSHTMRTESSLRAAYLSKHSTITALPVAGGWSSRGSQP